MPFAPVGAPSIGLAQIEAVVRRRFGDKVTVRTHYLNLDFAERMGDTGFYSQAVSPYARITGVADWFFRPVAFPGADDNTDEYLARYYFGDDGESVSVADFIRRRRGEMLGFLDDLIKKYDLASSDLVGFSLNFFQTAASIAMANRLKALNPGMTVVFGGPGVKGVPGKALVETVRSVDYVCSGPGLVSFPGLIAGLLAGSRAAIPEIRGIFVRGADGDIPPERVVGESMDINTDIPLDYGPFLDRFEEVIDEPGQFPYLPMQTSRGCWWADRQRCSFCGLNCLSEKFEAMSPDIAVRHIRSVLKYSERVSYFVACDNVAPPDYFTEVFPRIETPEGVHIKYEIRPDITADEIAALCSAGIRCVQPGVEALSTESLQLMRKGVSAFGNLRFLKESLRQGLFTEWNILLFSPGESEAVYRKYEKEIPLLTHLQPPVGVFPVEFVRDSRYFENPDEFGLALEPHASLFYIYPFDRETVSRLAYRFSDRNADTERMNRWLDKLGELVGEWRRKWSAGPDRRPRLVWWRDECGAVISDSRFRAGESCRLSDTEEALLEVLENPVTESECARKCGIDEGTARRTIARLTSMGVIFEERGRYMSLAVRE